MTWVNQIITAVEARGKVAWLVLFSCASALTLEHFFPDSLKGLPDWALPTIRIVGVFAFVLSFAAITPPATNFVKKLLQRISAPIKRRSIRRKLQCIQITEVMILSRALAQYDRIIWAKPDLGAIISLLDSGLIKHFWCGVARGDGMSSFEVPSDVWRILLSMEEFKMADPSKLVAAISSGQGNEAIRAALPQAHPAVRERP